MKKTLLVLVLCLAAGVLQAQENSKQTFTRNVLLEQFTTVNCGWCPAGMERIQEAVSTLENIIWIKHHAGFGTDFLTNNIHTSMLVFYGGSTFAPAMMMDRTRFDEEDDGPVCTVGQSSSIRQLYFKAKRVETYCNINPIAISFDYASRTVTGTVTGLFGDDNTWDANTRITVYLIEDSIVGEQHDYTDHGNWDNFVHMGTVRDVLTGMWGDPLVVNTSDRTFSFPINYTVPANYDFRHCKLVAFIYQYDASDINNCPVLNAAQSRSLYQILGIAEADQGSALSLFPNPAADYVILEADEAIDAVTIVNSLGQTVYRHTAVGGRQLSVNTSSLPCGLYLVNIRTAHGNATRKLNVTR